jgi:hypothetical protein
MTLLEPSVKIVFDENVFNEDRIWLSSGTEKVKDATLNKVSVPENTYIPVRPWKKPSEEDLKVLFTHEEGENYGERLGIVQFDPEQLQKLYDNGLEEAKTEEDADKLIENPEFTEIFEPIVNQIGYYLRTKDELMMYPITIRPANLLSLTYNSEINRYFGMHLENWDEKPLAEKHEARNRICLNWGKNDRYFHFINLSYTAMAEKLGLSGKELEEYASSENQATYALAWKFMNTFPDYPVVRIKIKPGEAYIAPTENILHDASSEGSSELDISLPILGYFEI